MIPQREVRVVYVSDTFSDTPEGMYRMDQLQRLDEAERAKLTDEGRAMLDTLERHMDAQILGAP